MMKRFVTLIAAAFLTFSLGILVTFLFPKHSSRSVPDLEPAHPVVVSTHRTTTRSPEVKWRTFTKGRVSFSIPAYLKKTGPPHSIGFVEAFGGPFVQQWGFYLYYSYGRDIYSDYNAPPGKVTDLIIDGQPAKLYVVEFEEWMLTSWKDRPQMHLVIPDVGDGRTKFELYTSSLDIDLMSEIMRSVHIR